MKVRARITASLVATGLAASLVGVVPAGVVGAAVRHDATGARSAASSHSTVMPQGPTKTTVHTSGGTATFTSGGSVDQVYTYGHTAGSAIDLLDSTDTVVQSGVADAQGALLFQNVAKGTGYIVRDNGAGGAESDPLTVTDPGDNPPQSFYDNIKLSEGYGYLPTRDGTLLSINVTFPKDGSKGPWPVVMDYSGYDPSQPGGPPEEAAFYPYRGYVTVGVNMRGTTCSGGRFSFFEPLQSTDGYDAVEALAAQSWSNGNVGLVGISYSGYSQLYVAATDPPHLRAITPLSPFGDTYRGILYPGGVLNNGFALSWATDRQNASRPANDQWVKDRIAGGDTTCAQDQVMRLQSQNILAEIQPGRFDERPLGDFLDPQTFVDKINVPVYLASQFQDEQTGGSAAELITILQSHPGFKAVLTNGTHVEGLGPTELPRVLEFVDFYVGHKIPALGPLLRVGIPPALQGIFGSTIKLPFDRFTKYATYDAALAAYEAEPKVRIRWENGGKAGEEGEPYSVYDTGYSGWPIPSVTAQRWYLQPDGQLALTAPTVADDSARASSSYVYDPTTRPLDTFGGSSDSMWLPHPAVDWEPLPEANSLSFVTPAYSTRTAYAGTGSVDLWIASTATDTDFEAELTLVYPDGHEQLVQSGWLRASRRKLDDARSTVLAPYETQIAPDSEPLTPGQFVPIRIPLFPFAEIVPPGAQLRLNIQAPGGNQPYWSFLDLPGTATDSIGHSAGMPSSVALPLLPTNGALNYVTSTQGTPNPCVVSGVTTQSVSDRGQPCREYHPARVASNVTATAHGDSVTVSWAAPPTWADGTGGTLTGYRVTNSGGLSAEVPADATSATDANVVLGEPMSYTVRAEYGSYVAPASDASNTVEVPLPTTAFLTAAYQHLFGRAPDSGGLAYWTDKLNHGMTRTQVALSLVASDEYRGTQVEQAYQSILGRAPSGPELAAGIAQLRPHEVCATQRRDVNGCFLLVDPRAVDGLRSDLLGSAAFYPTGGSASGYVTKLFTTEDGRAPTAGELAFGSAQLAAGWTRAEVAYGMLGTVPADTFLVTGFYQRYLGRTPGTADAAYWAGRLQAGVPESTVVAEFVGSAEFLAKATA